MNWTGPQSKKVHQMFSQVAAKYDLANNVLSSGIHHLWRKNLVQYSGAKIGDSILDCATGTGDLAIQFKKVVGPTGEVIGTDFCEAMLQPAPIKALQKNLSIHFQVADVQNLPFDDNKFNVTSISFGIRNVEDPVQGLKEMARVTKSGGQVMILEFSQVEGLFGGVFNFYSEKILPKIGGILTGQKQAYEYLQNSSARFPGGEKFVEMMNETKAFKQVSFKQLTGGIATMYMGTKI